MRMGNAHAFPALQPIGNPSNLCQDGSSWEAGICNAGPACKMLHPGQTLKYDCSGKGTECNGPTPTEIII